MIPGEFIIRLANGTERPIRVWPEGIKVIKADGSVYYLKLTEA